MREDLSVTVNGTPLTFIGSWGEAVGTWRRRGGSWELTWRMYLPLNYRHPDLVRGASVVARIGATSIWRGYISETNWDEQTFVAAGLCRQGETATAQGFGTLSSNPKECVSWGIIRGALTWSSFNALPNVPLTADADRGALNYVTEVLDAWAVENNVEWWINCGALALVNFAAAPASPRWSVTPGVGVLSLADEDYISDIYAIYAPSPGSTARVEAHDNTQGVGRVEKIVDLTQQGFITAAKAQAIIDGILAKTKARTGWSLPIQVTYGQIKTPGAASAALSHIAAQPNQMVRLLGLYDERGSSASTDIVVEETVLNFEEGALTIKPIGLADRDFASIVEAAGGVLL